MSAQRREDRWRRVKCMERAETAGQTDPAPDRQERHAYASGGTAPSAPPDWLVTKSLHWGYRLAKLVRLDVLSASPPSRVARFTAFGTMADHGPFLSLIPSPSGLSHPHPALPQAPAGGCRWTERYDGKRDLHLQHAA